MCVHVLHVCVPCVCAYMYVHVCVCVCVCVSVKEEKSMTQNIEKRGWVRRELLDLFIVGELIIYALFWSRAIILKAK